MSAISLATVHVHSVCSLSAATCMSDLACFKCMRRDVQHVREADHRHQELQAERKVRSVLGTHWAGSRQAGRQARM